ncbi:MAG: ATP-binding protein [Syntrophales bacterium]|nr:ATP-binding protein [Syntrophales bacterium]
MWKINPDAPSDRKAFRRRSKKQNILFLNFEDDRFAEFTTADFQPLYEAFLEVESPVGRKYFFLDEIQNLPGWHRWVNRLYEFEDIKLFITGSNSSILGGEAATVLTGRNRIMELYPFSFRELLRANDLSVEDRDFLITEKRVEIARLFNDYLVFGGFPEVVKSQDTSLLQEYFRDIIFRDVVTRYSVRNVREIRELALYLASNLSCMSSYKKLRDVISVNSLTTVKNYIGYFEDVYLFFAAGLFDYSLKRQMYNPSKMYCVDHAIASSIAFKFSEDIGRTIENIVFIELKRRGLEVYYWKDKKGRECDFLIKKGRTITEAVQVSSNISTMDTRDREITGAIAAAEEFGLKEVKMLTTEDLGSETVKGIKIQYIPIWRWLCSSGYEF